MLKEEKINDVVDLYNLFSRVVETYDYISFGILNYIKSEGAVINSNEKLIKDAVGNFAIKITQKIWELL